MAMKGIDNIAQRIIADAEAKAADILREAQERAQRIEENSRQRGSEELEQARKDAQERADEVLRRGDRAAQLESKKAQLAARQQMIDSAYDRALEKLLQLDDEKYTALLCSLCKEAAAQGGGELVFNPRDKERCGTAVQSRVEEQTGRKLTLAADTAGIPGGFILRQGKVEINCALDAVVRALSEQTAKDVAAILF